MGRSGVKNGWLLKLYLVISGGFLSMEELYTGRVGGSKGRISGELAASTKGQLTLLVSFN